jgi:drug/metabolite transporter (DMT)-like permease
LKNERYFVAAGYAAIVIIWSTTWLAIRIGLNSVPPISGIVLRFALGCLVLFILMRVRGERLVLNRHTLWLYGVLGVFSYCIPFVLLYRGELVVSTGLSSILFAAYPFVVAVASHFMLSDERMNAYKIIGIVLGFAGLLVIFWNDLHMGSAEVPAMAGILLSATLQGVVLVIVKKYGKDIKPIGLTFGGMFAGVIVLAVMALAFEDVGSIKFDAAGIGSIIYLAMFGNVVAFVVYYWLLKRVEAVYLSLNSFITPIFAVVLGVLVLHEVFSPRIFMGAALVLAGILVTNGKDIQDIAQKRIKRFTQ